MRRATQFVVLNIGVSQSHLLRREQILRDAGFAVLSTSVDQARSVAVGQNVCLAIFGHMVHPSDRLKISHALRTDNSKVRLVVMYDHSAQRTELADAVLQVGVPADQLVLTVEYLLSQGDPSALT